MTKSLNPRQAYGAMYKFLEKYYELTKADGVGVLLGSMALDEDGKPMDPAMWDEWLESVEDICNSPSDV